MLAICSRGEWLSGAVLGAFASKSSCKPETRIMKNSSKFEPKMARNFKRSSSGQLPSQAWSSTRSLKASHDNSRFKYRSGLWSSLSA
jgi:hypothetical protein